MTFSGHLRRTIRHFDESLGYAHHLTALCPAFTPSACATIKTKIGIVVGRHSPMAELDEETKSFDLDLDLVTFDESHPVFDPHTYKWVK